MISWANLVEPRPPVTCFGHYNVHDCCNERCRPGPPGVLQNLRSTQRRAISKPVEFLEVDVGVPALTEAGVDLGLKAAKLGVVPGCSMWPGRSQAGRRRETTFGQG